MTKNIFIEKQLEIGKSFTGQTIKDLEQETYAFCDFRNARFTFADLSGKKFIACNFGNTHFDSVKLNQTKLKACFSSIYAKIYVKDTSFEKAHLKHTHFVIDNGESREYITFWDDGTEELLHAAQGPMDYTITRKIDALLKSEFEKSLVFRLHLCLALFAEDGFHRSWMLKNLAHRALYDSPEYGGLLRLFIVSFLGDEYVGVREECLGLIKEIRPDQDILEFGVNRIFSDNPKDIEKGLRQLSKLLHARLVTQVNKQIEDRVLFLQTLYDSGDENKIYDLSSFASEDIAYFKNKK